MCDCPAHNALVDCNGCQCDHGPDRITQWKARALAAEAGRDALKAATEQLLTAQGKMLDRWAEANDTVRRELWQALHETADRVREVLATPDTAPQTPEAARVALIEQYGVSPELIDRIVARAKEADAAREGTEDAPETPEASDAGGEST